MRVPIAITQEGQWLDYLRQPDATYYNLATALRLEGTLRVGVLRQAIAALVERHQTLRTRFVQGESGGMQIVDPPGPVPLPVIDLGLLMTQARTRQMERVAVADSRRPFDLGAGQPLRVSLLRLADRDHVLLLIIHHIVSDAWSMGVLFRELSRLYCAFLTGEPASLPRLPMQFADYAVWQRDRLRGERLRGLVDYWRNELAGAPMLELPTDYPRLPGPKYRLGSCPCELSAQVTNDLRLLTARSRASLFMVLLAALSVVLGHHSGQTDILIGTPAANRARADTQGLIGFFVTTLVLRTDVSGNPTFNALLQRVRARTTRTYLHQEIPFGLLTRELPSLNELPFRVVLAYTRVGGPAGEPMRLSGIDTVTTLPLFPVPPLGVDLHFAVWAGTGELKMDALYNAELFEPRTMQGICSDYVSVLRQVAAEPGKPLSDLTWSRGSV